MLKYNRAATFGGFILYIKHCCLQFNHSRHHDTVAGMFYASLNLVTEDLCIFGWEEKQGKGMNNYSNRALISYYIICVQVPLFLCTSVLLNLWLFNTNTSSVDSCGWTWQEDDSWRVNWEVESLANVFSLIHNCEINTEPLQASGLCDG